MKREFEKICWNRIEARWPSGVETIKKQGYEIRSMRFYESNVDGNHSYFLLGRFDSLVGVSSVIRWDGSNLDIYSFTPNTESLIPERFFRKPGVFAKRDW